MSNKKANAETIAAAEDVVVSKDDEAELGDMNAIRLTDTFDSSVAGGVCVSRKQQPSKEVAIPAVIRWNDVLFQVLYISLFSMLGTSLRIFLGRLFGLDCILAENGTPIGDFFEGAALCITSDGKTGRGGPLFIDLPANMFGSVLMGIISQRTGPPIPWLSYDHPLQQNSALHVGFTVGFCGCLTTFASWNTQMIIMMDGSDTDSSPQIPQALFGYIIGITCCVASFLFGRLLGCCKKEDRTIPTSEPLAEVAADQTTDDQSTSRSPSVFLSECCTLPFILLSFSVVAIFAAYAVGDAVFNLPFYRGIWMATLFSPFGAVLRWKLSALNRSTGERWFPWGTFTANVVASGISVAADALQSNIAGSDNIIWISSLLLALEVGFAGSMSTVSTMVRELCSWKKTPWKSVLYFFVTVVAAIAASLALYSPIIRAG